MKKLLIIEWHKIWPYRTFKVLMSLYFIAAIAFFFAPGVLDMNGIDLLSKEFLGFPQVWPNITYFLSHFFNLVPAIIVIFLIANEFSYRTIRQNIIDGLSRKQIIIAKALMILALTVICTVFVILLGLVLGFIHSDVSVLTVSEFFNNTSFILGYFVSTFAVLSFAALLAFLLKRTGLTVIIFLLYITLIESIIRSQLSDEIARYLPSKAIFNVVEFPFREGLSEIFGLQAQTTAMQLSTLIAALYAIIFLTLSYMAILKRDM